MTQGALQFEPDSLIQLVVGMVRQLPQEAISRHIPVRPGEPGTIQGRRDAVVDSLLQLKSDLVLLDEALGADPRRFERR